MTRRRLAQHALQFATFLAFIGLWHTAASRGWINTYVLPDVVSAFSAFVDVIVRGQFWDDLRVTMFEYAVAFGLATAAGLIIGFLVSRSPYSVKVFDPLFAAMFSIPLVVLFPLFMLVFGLGPASKIAIGTVTAFFPIVMATVAGLSTVERSYINAARSMGASSAQLLFTVLIPAAFPVVLSGLRIGLIICFLSIIGTETLGAYAGLGRRIADLADQMDTAAMFGFIIFVVLVAWIINIAANVLEAAGRRRFQ